MWIFSRKEQTEQTPINKKSFTTEEILSRVDDWIYLGENLLIRLARVFLMLGFITGSIGIFTSKFDVSNSDLFTILWSIVQAIAIDGMLFAVWGQFHRIEKKWPNTGIILWYSFVGAMLAIVASLINNLITFEELNNIISLSQEI